MFDFIRKLLGRRALGSTAGVDADDDAKPLARDEALRLAHSEAIRDLEVTPSRISYINRSDTFDDFCRVFIDFDELGYGHYTISLLPLSERRLEERLTDTHIAQVALAGRTLNAVRLHRLLHGSTLLQAKRAIALMGRSASNARG
jgi:hypothetical protein